MWLILLIRWLSFTSDRTGGMQRWSHAAVSRHWASFFHNQHQQFILHVQVHYSSHRTLEYKCPNMNISHLDTAQTSLHFEMSLVLSIISYRSLNLQNLTLWQSTCLQRWEVASPLKTVLALKFSLS